jgi:hypothetical protein
LPKPLARYLLTSGFCNARHLLPPNTPSFRPTHDVVRPPRRRPRQPATPLLTAVRETVAWTVHQRAVPGQADADSTGGPVSRSLSPPSREPERAPRLAPAPGNAAAPGPASRSPAGAPPGADRVGLAPLLTEQWTAVRQQRQCGVSGHDIHPPAAERCSLSCSASMISISQPALGTAGP